MNNLPTLSVLSTGIFYLALSTSAQAASVQLGKPSYGGNGCPAGSASASISPDGKTLSILFDKYLVEAGGQQNRVSRKSCNLSIPVKVPNGLSVSLISADYRGFVEAPSGTSARLDTEYFFGGSRGPRFSHKFKGPHSAPYTKSHKLRATANVWSACGADVNLRVNSSTTVNSRNGQEAMATVDSADFQAGMVYRLKYRSCGTNNNNNANRPGNNHNNNAHRPNNNHNNHQPQQPNNNNNQPGGVTDHYYAPDYGDDYYNNRPARPWRDNRNYWRERHNRYYD